MKLLYDTIVKLNIFLLRDFGSNINRTTAKRLGEWATRLYIVLFVTSITILVLYAAVQSQVLTKTFDKPSFDVYNRLIKNYGDDLKCSCSIIASTYDQFVKIEPIFHQVRRNICDRF